jgi:hypothetical protein
VSDDGSISVYPNPSVNGKFTVSITNSKTVNSKLTVYSLDGKKIFEKIDVKEGINDINSGLKKGFYMIKINSYTHKLVIE